MKELIASLLLSFLIAETAQGVVTKYKHEILPNMAINHHLGNLEIELE
ncbi:hypothetical protein [Halobacteriovorax marinus]|nr:hypothetical protein [Halobacteriovorax marinus]